MYSTVCSECFNDIPVTQGQCPFCKVAAHEQKRLFVQDDGTEALWNNNLEDYPFPHELLKRRKVFSVLSLLFGTVLSSLIIFYSHTTSSSDAFSDSNIWDRGAMTIETQEQEVEWGQESKEKLKEASSNLSRQQTIR